MVVTAASANTESSITDNLGTHLTYTARCSSCDNHGSESIEEYYAVTSSATGSSFTISATMSGAASYDIYAFGITGANLASPFDSDFVANTLFSGHSGTSGTESVTGVSSSNANDMIVGLEGHASTTLQTAVSPFALIGSVHTANTQSIAAEDEMVSATQSGITVSFGQTSGGAWSMIIDAVEAAPLPTLTLAPTAGPPGQVITITGSNYAASTGYSDCLSTIQTSTASCIGGSTGIFTSGGTGTIPSGTTVLVPSGTATASDYVLVYSGSTITSSAGFSVGPSASLGITPSSGLPAQIISLTSGASYADSTTFNYCLSTSSSSVACISGTTGSFTSTASGGMQTSTAPTLTVPNGQAAGTYYVEVYSGTSTTIISSATFTVNSWVEQPVLVTEAESGAPVGTWSISTCSATPSSGSTGSTVNVFMTPSCSFTISFTNSGTTRRGFSISGGFSATSATQTSCSSGTCTTISLTAYYQLENTYAANPSTPTTWDAALTFPVAGTVLGSASTAGYCSISIYKRRRFC